MSLPAVRPGKFRPRCGACQQKFDLSVHRSGQVETSVGIEDGDDNLAAALGMAVDTTRRPVPRRPRPANTQRPRQQPAPDVTARPGGKPPADATAPPRATPTPNADQPTAAPTPQHTERAVDALLVTAKTTPVDVPARLGGYELQNKIGQGGMGSVYIARQISLDRDVALKLLAADLASDEEFVARFTREAYAAAQLTHHNVVQVYDIGSQRPHHYFSMELVPGSNLSRMSRDAGPMTPAEAVGLILQAGRGLRYAHEMGLVHRDVKPENLLINGEGIVKVADLGLAKRVGEAEPGGRITTHGGMRTLSATQTRQSPHTTKLDSASAASATQVSVAMGTPAYMAPEQAIDAAHVDQRADIYALGCSLYHLLTGRPPFEGDTAAEVMEAHTSVDPVPPNEIADAVPGSLGQIVLRMMAKRPADRYPTMRETIRVLEEWLEDFEGVGVTPTGDAEKTLAAASGRYVSASMKSVRTWLIVGFYAICVIAVVLFAVFADSPVFKVGLAGASIGLAFTTTIAYLVYAGIRMRTYLWSRLRAVMLDSGLVDALGLVLFTALLVAVLMALNLHWWWLGAAVLGLGLAIGFHHAVDVPLQQQREAPLNSVRLLLRRLRKEGYDENAIQHFIATKTGDHWEELYEELFGYDEKMDARPIFGRDGGKERARFGTWREPLLNWIDRRLEYKKRRRDEKMLIAVEKQRLRSKGVGEAVAEKQARANALRYADLAQNFRAEAEEKAKPTVPQPRAEEPTEEKETPDETKPVGTGEDAIQKRKVVYDDGKTNRIHESWFRRRFGSPIDIILGPQLRLLLGFVLMGVFALWANTASFDVSLDKALNPSNSSVEIDAGMNTAGGSRRVRPQDEIDAASSVKVSGAADDVVSEFDADTQNALRKYLPASVSRRLSGFNTAIAALILLTSIVFTPRIFAVFTYLAAIAAIALRGVPIVGMEQTINWWVAGLVGVGIYVFALTFYRTDEGY